MNTKQQLVRDEGVRLKPYTDTVGKLTIGIGRNLSDVGITQEEAEYLLHNDIDRAKTGLVARLPWVQNLDDARLGVLVNLTFNIGIEGVLAFKNTLALIQKGDYPSAAKQMLNSKWAAQVGDRAKRLAKQLETGEWQ